MCACDEFAVVRFANVYLPQILHDSGSDGDAQLWRFYTFSEGLGHRVEAES